MGLTRERLEANIKSNLEKKSAQEAAFANLQARVEAIANEGDRKIAPLQIRKNQLIEELERLRLRPDVDDAERSAIIADLEQAILKTESDVNELVAQYRARAKFETDKRSQVKKALVEIEADIRLDERLLARMDPAPATPARRA